MATERFGEKQTPTTESARSTDGTSDAGQTTKDAAKDQALNVAQEGVEGGKHVATVAADQAKEVASEAGRQGKALYEQARTELMDQLSSQQERAADQLHSISQQLGSMASTAREEGPAKDLAQQASRQLGKAAHWLAERDPSALVSELKGFARNKPGTFLAMTAGIGMMAGRMTRGAKAGPPEESNGTPSGSYDQAPQSALRQRMATPHRDTTPDYGASTMPGGMGSYTDAPLTEAPLTGDPLTGDPLAPRTTGLAP